MRQEEFLNKVLLKPRFYLERNESPEKVWKVFTDTLNDRKCPYCHVKSMNHLFIDVPEEEQHFWSPQLQVEILPGETKDKTVIKGVVGPKPHVWTLYMFVYFFITVGWIFAGVWLYVHWSLKKPVQLQTTVFVVLTVLWILVYLSAQIGKKLARKQTEKLKGFLKGILMQQGENS